ncbi:MAG: glycosyltransferase [Bacteroidales bacterium]|jgi:glycosyltransferase involved in cell wall biosynthesis
MFFEQLRWIEVIAIIFIFSFAVQLFYYLFFFARLVFYKPKQISSSKEPVSVVICAKNEADNLQENLPLILQQDYPQYEVVVVNDCSDDHTEFILHDFAKKYSHLKIINLLENVNFFSGKKFPLSIGIKSAKYNNLLLTDADCKPISKNWINSIAENFLENTSIVLGYGAYKKKKGILNKLIRYDTFFVALQYLSYALAKIPYMGVGRNLAYKKELFIENKGFTSHYKIQSGDDDLFINNVANKYNTRISVNRDSHILSEPCNTFSSWIIQKKRHLSSGNLYKFKHKFLLGMFIFTQFLFFMSFIALISLNFQVIALVLIFLLRFIIQILVFKNCMKKLNEKDLLLISPLFEIFFILFNPIIYISNRFYKIYAWK